MTSMYSTEMIMTLLGCSLNLKQLANFYDRFLVERWDYFFKVVLNILRIKELEILKCEDLGELIVFLKQITMPPILGQKPKHITDAWSLALDN